MSSNIGQHVLDKIIENCLVARRTAAFQERETPMKCPRCGGTGQVLDDIETGKKFREARIKAGFTGRQLAERMNLSASYLSDLELGRRSWNAAKVKRFMDALKEPRY